jgi:Spy/CpxP family protein refolding chaperone
VLAPLRDRIRETARASGRARRRLFEATQQSPFDEQAIRAAARESARCEEDLSVLRGRVADELRKILTAEQRRAMDRAAELFADALEKRASEAGSLVDAWLDQNPAGGPR